MSAEKAPVKKKIPKIVEVKKPIIIGSIIAMLAITIIVIGVNIADNSDGADEDIVLIYGGHTPEIFDPLDMQNLRDIIFIEQVAEGLFAMDLTSPNSDIIPCLALDHNWSSDDLNLTCTLRQGVEFHDGTQFNATAVKWNFDRMYTLRDNLTFYNYWHPYGSYLINQTQVLGNYIVRFVLNSPYAPFVSLLSSYPTFILSPSSTPKDDFIKVNESHPVGTGPFKFDYFNWEVNISMRANLNYWGEKPKIDQIVFIPGDTEDLLEAMQLKQIHLMLGTRLNESQLEPFISNSSFIVHEGIPDNFLDWIHINNELINITMRKAIAYAFNYSSVIEATDEIDRRAKSPLPERFRYYNVTDIKFPIYNISLARQTLIDANWNGTAGLTANNDTSPGNPWEKKAQSNFPLAKYNFSHVIEWSTEYLEEPLVECLKQIGVNIEIVNITVIEFFLMGYEWFGYHRNMLNFAYNFWMADYNDPSNYINFFYSDISIENWMQFNDTQSQDWMDEALIKTNPLERRNLYYNLQKRFVEELYPNIWLTNRMRRDIYVSNLKGWYPNPYKVSFKSVYFEN